MGIQQRIADKPILHDRFTGLQVSEIASRIGHATLMTEREGATLMPLSDIDRRFRIDTRQRFNQRMQRSRTSLQRNTILIRLSIGRRGMQADGFVVDHMHKVGLTLGQANRSGIFQ